MSHIFNLKEVYCLYLVHHNNKINKIIHILFIPVTVFSACILLNNLPTFITDYIQPFLTFISGKINISTICALMLSCYCCYLDLKIGLITSAWIMVTNYLATTKIEDIGIERASTQGVRLLAIALVLLMVGHIIFEGITSIPTLPAEPLALFVAPLFITMEFIFMIGYLNDQRLSFQAKVDGYFTASRLKKKLKKLGIKFDASMLNSNYYK